MPQPVPKEHYEPPPPLELSDREAVARTLSGARETFEILVRRYERPIFAHLLRLTGRREDAEDLAQETFLKALRALATYRPEFPFRAWIYRIATNTAISALRRRGPIMISLSGGEDERPIDLADPRAVAAPVQISQAEMVAQLERAAAALPPQAAALLELRYRRGLSLEEIGLITGRRPGAVAVAVHRLRRRLRELIFG